MKVLQAVTIAAAALCLVLQQAEARDIVRADTKCTCDPQGPAYQLLRGDNQVKDCQVGFYCECAKEKRLQCVSLPFGLKWKYDEDNQECVFSFDCAAFFRRTTPAPTTTEAPTTEPSTAEPSTAEPSTTEPSTAEPSTTEPSTTEATTTEAPTTEPSTTEATTTEATTTEATTTEATTTEAPTTEPSTTEATTTEATTTEAPTTEPSTPEPSTPEPSTTEPSTTEPSTTPTPKGRCSCSNPDGPAYQLIRGDDEVEKCDDGYYCDCSKSEVDRCLDAWGVGWRFDEVTQKCTFEYDCAAYLKPSTTPEPSTTEASTTEASTTEASTTEASTTEASTTEASTTEASTTEASTTEASTTEASTTEASTTEASTTEASTTEASTTEASTTEASTTEASTTTVEPTSTPSPNSCSCDPEGPVYQLIRGDDEVAKCDAGYFCDCNYEEIDRCFHAMEGYRFDEETQECAAQYDCDNFFHPTTPHSTTTTEGPTTEPTTPELTTTTTNTPAPLGECSCDQDGPAYQLLRGAGQASSCTHGYYCDCDRLKRKRCLNALTLGWRFDEDAQKCRLFHSCRALIN